MNSNISVQDCKKTYSYDQDKARTPEQTIIWVKERLRAIDFQILSQTMRIDSGRLDIPVYISLCAEEATRYTGTKKQMGKGATPAQSEASAVMELVERFSFFHYIHQSYFPSFRYTDVADRAISPDVFLQSVHDRNTQPDAAEDILRQLPLRWAVAHNLTRKVDQLIPIDWFYLINEYNGPAAGNTIEEAILQSLCEVVERHVGSIISYGQRETPEIDPESLQDPAALQLVEKFERNGIKLFLRDFSLDTGIPSVGALAYDPASFPDRSEIIFTAGTTSSPEKSLCRALTEIAQLAGDFENRTSYRPTLPKYTSLEEAHYLMNSGRKMSIADLPNLEDDNLRIEIENCVAALERLGLEILVLNVTHPKINIPSVYTIIPGAHFLDHTLNTDFPQHAARTLLRSLPARQAIPHLQRLLEVFGPRYDLTFFLAHSLELEGEAAAALELFEAALDQQPDGREIASIYVHMASCQKDLEEFEAALENLAIAERHNDELKEIYNLRGFCCYKLKRHHEAIAAFERAIEIDPGSAIDYANIGSNLRELGHKEEAVRLYQMALELDPDIDFARTNIALLEAELAARRSE
jgi:ribosomal protein S12 methylthiotransferase accessory factor